MRYREIDVAELPALVRDVNQAVFWVQYVEFARKFYGESAVRLECETHGEYNDEGGTNYTVNSVTAFDAGGNEIEVDYDGPCFDVYKIAEIQRRRASEFWTREYPNEVETVDAGDMENAYYEEECGLPIADESEYSFTVDLTKEPTRPRIAIIEDD